jgi:hypothetical protein
MPRSHRNAAELWNLPPPWSQATTIATATSRSGFCIRWRRIIRRSSNSIPLIIRRQSVTWRNRGRSPPTVRPIRLSCARMCCFTRCHAATTARCLGNADRDAEHIYGSDIGNARAEARNIMSEDPGHGRAVRCRITTSPRHVESGNRTSQLVVEHGTGCRIAVGLIQTSVNDVIDPRLETPSRRRNFPLG